MKTSTTFGGATNRLTGESAGATTNLSSDSPKMLPRVSTTPITRYGIAWIRRSRPRGIELAKQPVGQFFADHGHGPPRNHLLLRECVTFFDGQVTHLEIIRAGTDDLHPWNGEILELHICAAAGYPRCHDRHGYGRHHRFRIGVGDPRSSVPLSACLTGALAHVEVRVPSQVGMCWRPAAWRTRRACMDSSPPRWSLPRSET